MTVISPEKIEAAARAICIAQGYDPKTLDEIGSYSKLPLWKDKLASAEAALAAAALAAGNATPLATAAIDLLDVLASVPWLDSETEAKVKALEKALTAAEPGPVCCGNPIHDGDPERYVLECCGKHHPAGEGRRYQLGDRVRKTKGASWQGRVVGYYSTKLTPVGYAVESEREPGSVQIYPEAALTEAGRG